ncbi:MAG: hypothetical protein DHS20C15_08840 [Planctomycetota bacterium]|nr:MAG: hypothetical protein DHS20C15_08840 [Planctomycetota bacterium]
MPNAVEPESLFATESTAEPSTKERAWGALVHAAALIPIPGPNVILPLLIWLVGRDESEFVDDQGRQSVDFQLSMLLLYLASIPLLLIGVGFLLIWILPLLNMGFVLWAAVMTAQGERFRYPFRMGFIS